MLVKLTPYQVQRLKRLAQERDVADRMFKEAISMAIAVVVDPDSVPGAKFEWRDDEIEVQVE